MIDRRFICSSSIAALVAAFATTPWACALDQVWQNSGSSNVWDTGTVDNWSSGPFVSGDNAIFGGTGETVDVSGNFAVGNMTFNASGYVIADANADGSLLVTDGSVITLGQTGASTTIISAPVTTGSFTVTRGVGSTGTATLELSGANLIAGTLTLGSVTGANTTVRLGSSAATSSSTIVNVSGVAGTTNEFLLNGFSTTIGGLTNAGGGTRRFRNSTANLVTLTIDVVSGNSYNYGSQLGNTTAASGNGNRFGVVKTGAGLQEFTSTAAMTATQAAGVGYFGDTIIQDGALGFAPIAGVANGATSSLLILDGGVLQSTGTGTFSRSFGATTGSYLVENTQFRITANGGGFSAKGGKLTVNIGGAGATLDWGTSVGTQLVGPLKFGHVTATAETEVLNPINLNGAERTLNATDNPAVTTDFATLSGVLADGSSSAGIVKTGTGTIVLAAANTYTGATRIEGGTLAFNPGALPAGTPITFTASGALRWNGVNTVDLSPQITIEDSATGTIDTGANHLVFNTPLQTGPSQAGALGKAGTGSLTLNTANVFSNGAVLAGGMLFAANDLSLGTGPIALSGGGLASSSTAARTFSNPLSITQTSTVGDLANNGLLTFNGLVDFGGGARTLTVNSDAVFAAGSWNGRIGTKLGPATLTLQGANNWNGFTEVRDGLFLVDGSLTMSDAIRVASYVPGGTATATIASGASVVITLTSANFRIGYTGGDPTAANIANVSGSLTLPTGAAGGFVQMGTASAAATLNLLAGGNIATRGVQDINATAVTTLNFDGGMLTATESSSTFLQGLDAVNVKAGAARFDSNGFDISVAQVLAHDPALGATPDGGLMKNGSGSLTLTGANTYTGGTTINGGTLAFIPGALPTAGIVTFAGDSALRWEAGNTEDISARLKINNGVTASMNTNGNDIAFATALQIGGAATGGLAKIGLGTLNLGGANTYTGLTSINEGRLDLNGSLSSNVTVADGAAIGGDGLIAGTLTIGSAAGADIYFDATTPAALSSTGTLTLNGVNSVNVVNPAAGAGIVVLHSDVPIAGSLANLQLANAGDFRAGTALSFNGGGNEVLFDLVTGSVKWNGDLSDAWDNNGTFNWRSGVTPDKFYLGDAVTFDDTAAGPNFNPTIDAGVIVRPASITFNNSAARPYTISGAGSIAGQTGLIKNGNGLVLIATDNTFTGPVTINAGTLQLGDGSGASGSVGTGPITNNASLVLNFAGTASTPNDISGSGALTKNGFGSASLSGANSYGGVTNVNAGTLVVGSPTALGSTFAGTVIADGAQLAIGNPMPNGSTIAEAITFQGGFDQALSDLQVNDARTGITLSGALTLMGDVVFVADTGTSIALTGGITGGSAGIAVNTTGGTGTMTFAAANSYSGRTTLGGGMLQAGSSTAFGTGTLEILAGTLSSTDVTARTFTNPLVLSGSATLGHATNSGILTFTGATTLNTSSQLTVASPVVLSGVIDDAGLFFGLVKSDTSNLTLTAANTFAGGTTIFAGKVFAGHNQALGTGTLMLSGGAIASDGLTPRTLANPVTITGASTLGDSVNSGALIYTGPFDFNGAGRFLTIPSDVTLTGPSANGGLQQKLGAGTLTIVGDGNPLTVDADWSSGGVVEVRAGTLILDAVNIVARDALRAMATGTPGSTARAELRNGATFAIDAVTANLRVGHESSTITDGINILDIAGALSFSPLSTAGSLQLGSDSALARVNLKAGGLLTVRSVGLGVQVPAGGVQEFNFDGGTLRAFVNNGNFFNNVLTAAYVKAGGGTIDTNGFNVTIAQNLQHDPALGVTPDGGFTKNGLGTLTLTGTQGYSSLTANEGTTSLQAALGTGDSSLDVNAAVNTNVSQTLAALNIGDGGVLTLNAAPAPAEASFYGDSVALDDTSLDGVTAVPEPGSVTLLAASFAAMLGLRRRRA